MGFPSSNTYYSTTFQFLAPVKDLKYQLAHGYYGYYTNEVDIKLSLHKFLNGKV